MSRVKALSDWRTWLAIASLLAAGAVQALPGDREKNFELESDQQTFDQKSGRVTYSGSARLQQGSLIIQADQIVVHFKSDNTVEQITATGSPATFEQQPSIDQGVISARAGKIIYHHVNNTVQMSRNAHLEQDGATMQGERIDYDLSQELVQARGSDDRRIRMVIPPGAVER